LCQGESSGGKRITKELKLVEGAEGGDEGARACEEGGRGCQEGHCVDRGVSDKQLQPFLAAVLTTGANNSEVRVLSAEYISVCLSDRALSQFFFARWLLSRVFGERMVSTRLRQQPN
jgi:hypothetical protein